MLSRVAERLFWTARYLERAESLARVIKTLSRLRMDVPKGTELPWTTLLTILGNHPEYKAYGRALTETNIMKFMISEIEIPTSILFAVNSARENARTTRGVLPTEVWECLNELYLFCKDNANKSVARKNRFKFLNELERRCQLLNGLMMLIQRRDHGYRFITLGHLLERIDFTLRVINTLSSAISERIESNPAFDSLIWAGLLESLAARGSYRRSYGPLVEPDSAINFLVLEPELPRSIAFCVKNLKKAYRPMKKKSVVMPSINLLEQLLLKFNAFDMSDVAIREALEQVLLTAFSISDTSTKTWFMSESI
ncbi:MAG: hypothetical protein CMK36_06460 [Porticoccaceae bacterium]|nr:hypothetical protein [Porticoccaceae bacterium]